MLPSCHLALVLSMLALADQPGWLLGSSLLQLHGAAGLAPRLVARPAVAARPLCARNEVLSVLPGTLPEAELGPKALDARAANPRRIIPSCGPISSLSLLRLTSA